MSFPESLMTPDEQARNPFLRLCAIVAHLRELGVPMPGIMGALPGPQQSFEGYLRTKFNHRGFQAWLLVKLDDGGPAWQCHSHRTILAVEPTQVEAMIVAWACDHGASWWIDADFVCAERLELVRQWVVEALPLARFSTQGDRAPTHVRIGSRHCEYFSGHMAGNIGRYAAAQDAPDRNPWCWHWLV